MHLVAFVFAGAHPRLGSGPGLGRAGLSWVCWAGAVQTPPAPAAPACHYLGQSGFPPAVPYNTSPVRAPGAPHPPVGDFLCRGAGETTALRLPAVPGAGATARAHPGELSAEKQRVRQTEVRWSCSPGPNPRPWAPASSYPPASRWHLCRRASAGARPWPRRLAPHSWRAGAGQARPGRSPAVACQHN